MTKFAKTFGTSTYLRNLEDKKKQVLASIEEQGKLTGERGKKSRQRKLW